MTEVLMMVKNTNIVSLIVEKSAIFKPDLGFQMVWLRHCGSCSLPQHLLLQSLPVSPHPHCLYRHTHRQTGLSKLCKG